MKILVCIKQVPDSDQIKINYETNTLDRSKAENIINPYDLNAIEEAVRIREKIGGKITVISMGPIHTKTSLREALARGADEAYLVSDKIFAGADTYATSYALSKAIEHLGEFDLIICGKQAIDGETAQVGAELAGFLDLPYLPYASGNVNIDKNKISIESLSSEGLLNQETILPAVITVTKSVNIPRLVNLKKLFDSYNTEIKILTGQDIKAETEKSGLKGSPTKVKKIKIVNYEKKAVFLEGNPAEIAVKIFELINKKMSDINSTKEDIKLLPVSEVDTSKKIYIIAEVNGHKITRSSYQLVYIAKKLSNKLKGEINFLVLTDDAGKVEKENIIPDVHNFIILENGQFEKFDVSVFKEAVFDFLARSVPEIVLGSSTLEGRTLLPSLAVKFHTGLTADCTELDIDEDKGILIQTRPAFGGNILASIECENKRPQMATIRPGNYPFIEALDPKPSVSLINIKKKYRSALTINKLLKNIKHDDNMQDSRIIISGGRGIGSRKDFELVKEAALLLNAESGASRSAVDAGWIDYYNQIGQTGRIVSPKVYLALGISGAVQHLAGMQSSEMIIAVNKDINAQIFNVSDYAVVSDYKIILTELIKVIRGSS